MSLTLHWTIDSAQTYHFPTAAGRIILGRAEPCDIIIQHPTVSRRHVEFVLTPDHLQLFNLKARNPALVNGTAVPQFQSAIIRPGDKIQVGAVIIQVAHSLSDTTDKPAIKCHNCQRLVQADQDYCPWCGMMLA